MLYLCKQELPWGKLVGPVPHPHCPSSTHPALFCPPVSALWKRVATTSLPRPLIHLTQAMAKGFSSLPNSLLPQKHYGKEEPFHQDLPWVTSQADQSYQQLSGRGRLDSIAGTTASSRLPPQRTARRSQINDCLREKINKQSSEPAFNLSLPSRHFPTQRNSSCKSPVLFLPACSEHTRGTGMLWAPHGLTPGPRRDSSRVLPSCPLIAGTLSQPSGTPGRTPRHVLVGDRGPQGGLYRAWRTP